MADANRAAEVASSLASDQSQGKVMGALMAAEEDGNKLTKVIVAGKPLVNIEKIQKIAKAVRSIELLVEFENR